jgi:hypothetical protein
MDENFNEKLDLDELYSKKKITRDTTINTYKKILARVHKKIKTTARMRNSDNFCFFLLPEFILGIPKYDNATCNSYVIEKLTENGFNVKYTHPNLLFISWNHYIPSYERRDIKKKTGMTVDGFGNIIKKKTDNSNKHDGDTSLLISKKLSNKIKDKNHERDDKSKNFKNISTYKPTGNLIYNKKFVREIEDKLK